MILHDDLYDIEYREAVQLQTRTISPEEVHTFEGYTAEIFSALGLDLNTPATKDTLEAHHLCVEMRGVRETAPTTRTTIWRGPYAEDPSLRSEFFSACGLQRNEK